MLKRTVVFAMVVVFGILANFTFAQEIGPIDELLLEEAVRIKEGQKSKFDKLTSDLNLTKEQQTHVREIFAKAEILIENIMAQSREAINQVRSTKRDEIKAILTEEQKVIFDEQESIKRGLNKKNGSVPEVSGAKE